MIEGLEYSGNPSSPFRFEHRLALGVVSAYIAMLK